jgi:hypothetical protein
MYSRMELLGMRAGGEIPIFNLVRHRDVAETRPTATQAAFMDREAGGIIKHGMEGQAD